jgi:acyl-CoA thioester hydrolase
MTELQLADFPFRTFDKIRYGDTDRQGHVNNAVFATFFETGRVGILNAGDKPVFRPGFSFVIARLAIDFKAEILWPGTVDIATGVKSIGRSSVNFLQALFQDGKCVAIADSVVVHVDGSTHRSTPITDEIKTRFEEYLLPPG